MTALQMIKQPGGMLRPANQTDADALAKVPNGRLVSAEVIQMRNPLFHRKFFALLNFGFEYWTPAPVEINGVKIEAEKNFERFRKDILIMAGYRKTVVNIKGEARYEAESISFANMDEARFSELYRHVFGVLWKLVLRHVDGMTEQAANQAMEEMLRFD